MPQAGTAISSKNLGSFQWEMVFRYHNLRACLCDWLLFMWTELENELCICFKWNIPYVFMKFQFKLRPWRFSFNLMDLTVLLPIFHTKIPVFNNIKSNDYSFDLTHKTQRTVSEKPMPLTILTLWLRKANKNLPLKNLEYVQLVNYSQMAAF